MLMVMIVVGIDLKTFSATFNLKNQPLFSPAIWRSQATFFVDFDFDFDFDIKKKYRPYVPGAHRR